MCIIYSLVSCSVFRAMCVHNLQSSELFRVMCESSELFSVQSDV